MSFRRTAVLALTLLAVLVPAAGAHKGNPNYLSEIREVTPQMDGVSVQVLSRDDRLEVRNDGDFMLVIHGYNDEPYARIHPDGTVEVNTRSPAYYLNKDRYGEGDLPPEADEKAPPEWKKETGNGRFEWHDHRMHWMAKSKPEQVKDEDVRTKIFDWEVPITYGGEPGAIEGRLFWVPKADGGVPTGAIIAFVIFVLASGVLIVVVRRRRGRPGGDAPAAGGGEAW